MTWTEARILGHVKKVGHKLGDNMTILKQKQEEKGAIEKWGFEHVQRLQWYESSQPPGRQPRRTLCVTAHGIGCARPTCHTCHSCRQKIIDCQSTCATCGDHWCGSCLVTRMGEDPQETFYNNAWVCPRCRHICNCSASSCQRSKPQWSAKVGAWVTLEKTGMLSSEAVGLGFKSTAHYLMFTHFDANTVAEPLSSSGRRSHTAQYHGPTVRPAEAIHSTKHPRLNHQQEQVAVFEADVLRVMPDLLALMGAPAAAPPPDLGIGILGIIASNSGTPVSNLASGQASNHHRQETEPHGIAAAMEEADDAFPITPQLGLAGAWSAQGTNGQGGPCTMLSILHSHSPGSPAHQRAAEGARRGSLPNPVGRLPAVTQSTSVQPVSNERPSMFDDENSPFSAHGKRSSSANSGRDDNLESVGGHNGLGFGTLIQGNTTGPRSDPPQQQLPTRHGQHRSGAAPAVSPLPGQCQALPFANVGTAHQKTPPIYRGAPRRDVHWHPDQLGAPRAPSPLHEAGPPANSGDTEGFWEVQGRPQRSPSLQPIRNCLATPPGGLPREASVQSASIRADTPAAADPSPVAAAASADKLLGSRVSSKTPHDFAGNVQWHGTTNSPTRDNVTAAAAAAAAAGLRPQLWALQRIKEAIARARAGVGGNPAEDTHLEEAAVAVVLRGLNILERFNADRAVINAANSAGKEEDHAKLRVLPFHHLDCSGQQAQHEHNPQEPCVTSTLRQLARSRFYSQLWCLESLTLSDCSLQPGCFTEVVEAAQSMPALRFLDLSHNPLLFSPSSTNQTGGAVGLLGSGMSGALGQILTSCSRLTALSLQYTGMDEAALEQTCACIRAACGTGLPLRVLRLGSPSCGAFGAPDLLALLQAVPTVEAIVVWGLTASDGEDLQAKWSALLEGQRIFVTRKSSEWRFSRLEGVSEGEAPPVGHRVPPPPQEEADDDQQCQWPPGSQLHSEDGGQQDKIAVQDDNGAQFSKARKRLESNRRNRKRSASKDPPNSTCSGSSVSEATKRQPQLQTHRQQHKCRRKSSTEARCGAVSKLQHPAVSASGKERTIRQPQKQPRQKQQSERQRKGGGGKDGAVRGQMGSTDVCNSGSDRDVDRFGGRSSESLSESSEGRFCVPDKQTKDQLRTGRGECEEERLRKLKENETNELAGFGSGSPAKKGPCAKTKNQTRRAGAKVRNADHHVDQPEVNLMRGSSGGGSSGGCNTVPPILSPHPSADTFATRRHISSGQIDSGDDACSEAASDSSASASIRVKDSTPDGGKGGKRRKIQVVLDSSEEQSLHMGAPNTAPVSCPGVGLEHARATDNAAAAAETAAVDAEVARRSHHSSPSLANPLTCGSKDDPQPRLRCSFQTDGRGRQVASLEEHAGHEGHTRPNQGDKGVPALHPQSEVGKVASGCLDAADAPEAAAASEEAAAASEAPQPAQLAAEPAQAPDSLLARTADSNLLPQELPIEAAGACKAPDPAVSSVAHDLDAGSRLGATRACERPSPDAGAKTLLLPHDAQSGDRLTSPLLDSDSLNSMDSEMEVSAGALDQLQALWAQSPGKMSCG